MKKILSFLVACVAACGWGAVAKIGDTEYATLTAACAAAQDGETVTLLQNVSESPVVTAACTVDLGGFTVTGCVYGQYNTRGGVCTIKNGTATSGFDGASGTDKTYPYGALVVENFNMNNTFWTDGHPVIVKGGTFLKDIRVGSQPVVVESGYFKTKFVRDGAGYPVLKGGRYAQDVSGVAKIAYGYQFVRDDADATYPYAVTPVTATRALWTGAAGDGDLANVANWSCVDASGTAVADTAPVATGSILCLNGETAFNCPAGTTPLWKSVAFLPLTGAPQDVCGSFKRGYETKYYNNPAKSNTTDGLAMIDSTFVFFPEAYLNYGGTTTPVSDLANSTWKSAHLDNATASFSGWVYVPDSQAGFWTVYLESDDYCGMTLDGELVHYNLTYKSGSTSATFPVTPGWHTYTFVCGDTWGGESAKMPTISINGASEVAFTAANFTFGTAANTVKLTADCDWRGLGTLTLPAGLTLDLNGHNLAIAGAKGTFKGGVTISGTGTVTVDGGTFDDNGITASNATLVFTNSVVAKATWTGAGAADNVNDPANWSCQDADGHTVAGGVPGATTVVSVDTSAMTLQVPAGQTLATAYLQPSTETFTLAADCDWRGAFTSAQLPSTFDGVRIPYLDAPKGSFINTGFKPNGNTHAMMDVTVQSTGEYWLGAWNTSRHQEYNFSLCNDGTCIYVAYQNQNFGWGSALGNGRHLVELDRNYFLCDGTLQCHRLHATFTVNYPLYFFAQNRKGTAGTHASQGTIRFHEGWIYDNGTLVRHFVPVRKSDGTVGMYDLKNKAFYANGGSGTFTGGVSADAKSQATYLPQRTIDLAGHSLALAPLATENAVTVTDSSSDTSGELHLHITPEQTFKTTTFTFSGNTKVVFETAGASLAVGTKLLTLTEKPEGVIFALDTETAVAGIDLVVTSDGVFYGADPDSQDAVWAHWTGAAGDNDPASGDNWAATNLAGRAIANAVLTSETHVYLHGTATVKVPASGFTVKTLDLGSTGVLTLDASSWTGKAGQAILTTTDGITPMADLALRVRIVNPRLDVQLSADGTQILAIAKATMAWRHLKISSSDYSINGCGVFWSRPLAEYTTYVSPTNTFQPAVIGKNTTWQKTYLMKGCDRYDGWFLVTDAQAGEWKLTQYYDDYMAFVIDGDCKLMNPTYSKSANATFSITAGWHHFTIVCGDTAGDYGYVGSDKSSLMLQINNAETLVPFDERTFTFDDATACASGDLAVTSAGETPVVTCEVAADCRLVLDPAVTHLTLMRAPVFTAGAKFALAAKYAEATAGSFTLMTWEKGAIDTQGVALNDLFDATSAQGASPAVTVVTNADGSGALRLTLDAANDAVTAHWVGTVDNDISKPGNWLCTNAAGETVTAVPGWGTDVFIDAEACNLNVPAGTTLAYATLTLADTVTLAADCDWSGLDGRLTWLVGKTIDVNGHALTLTPTYDIKGGTVTSGVTGGACRLMVSDGIYVVNTGLTLTGSLRFVKDGAGTFRAEKKNQSYTEGTFIEAGLATSPVTGWSPWNGYIWGVRKSVIRIAEGAILDTAGNFDYRGFDITLAGGTLRNSGADMDPDLANIGSLTLTADSVLDFRMTTGTNGANDCPNCENGVPVFQLNGHTLDVRLAEGKYWKPKALIIRNGLVRVRGTDGNIIKAQLWNYGDISAETADLDIGCRLEIKNNVAVRDFTCRWAETWGWSETGKVVTVNGTFHPVSDYFCNVHLIDGATLDLSTKSDTWSTLSLDNGNSKSFYATFAENATIKLDTGTRTFASGEKVISWTAQPTGTKFRAAKAGSSYSFSARPDGVYVCNGFMIYVR